ncbi:MAG: 1-acyl-sn-glycerol-3-phosphate acyltransferase [Nanoarchaeota archaeon]|nr:1-acyl-sn-glycerol-3-phosphate acyltransferase [Nanoarchaeota archaeon]
MNKLTRENTKKILDIFYRTPIVLFINFYRLLIRIKIFNMDSIPEDKAGVFAINHPTGADPIILLAAVKKKIYFLADGENFRSTFTSFFMRKCTNSIPIFKKRFMKNIKSFKAVFSISLNKNVFLGIFPEGKLNKKDKLEKFHKGAAYLSYKTKLPIIPVYIHNVLKGPSEKRLLGRNVLTEGIIALIINIFRKIHIFIGEPINPIAENIIKDSKNLTDKKSYKQIVENIHKALEEEFLELKTKADKLFSPSKENSNSLESENSQLEEF